MSCFDAVAGIAYVYLGPASHTGGAGTYACPDRMAVQVSTHPPNGEEHDAQRGEGGVPVQSNGRIQQVPGPCCPQGRFDAKTCAQKAPGVAQSSDVLHVVVPTPH